METSRGSGARRWKWWVGPLALGMVILARWGWPKGTSETQSNSVVVYCAQDQVFAEPLLADFSRQTGIRVKPVFDSEAVKTVGLANRLLAERANPVCEVFWGNEELRTRQLAAAGVFADSPSWKAWGQRRRQFVVRTSELERWPAGLRMSELTNAAWRGKVSLAYPLFGTTATHLLVLRQHWGDSEWRTWCRALAANQPFLEEGNSHVVRRVARGEAMVGLTDSDDILAAQREGLPVAAIELGPETLLIPNTVGVVDRPGGPRPAAVKLFEYLQSPVVQDRLIAAGALDAAPMPASTPVLRPDWNRLLPELDRGLAELQEMFRR